MSKPIYIHAGAHRTGTSSFQLCLHLNREALGALGFDLAYPGRDGTPGGELRLRLPAPRHGPDQREKFVDIVRRSVSQASPDPARALVLSEENIPGRMFHFFEGRFFPASRKRLETLRDGLGTRPAHVLYVVREYGALYASAWRKRAEDNPVAPFADSAAKLVSMDRGWPELLAEVRDVLQPQRLTVVPYERRGESRELLARLVPGLRMDDLVEPTSIVNLSASDAALEVLQERFHAGEELDRTAWRQVITEHAGSEVKHGLTEYSSEQRAELLARYDADLRRISEMPGVEFG